MTWNYRIVKKSDDYGQTWYGIHEYFYKLDGDKDAWTKEPVAVVGETPEVLRDILQRMLQALDRPIVDDDDTEEIHE